MSHPDPPLAGQMQGRRPEGDRTGGRGRPRVHQEQAIRSRPGVLQEPPSPRATSAPLPLRPVLWLPLLPPAVDSSRGTCILWLLEGPIPWEPMKVTEGHTN